MSRQLLNDFPSGPLDIYRKHASFNWKQMKIFIYGEENIKDMDYMIEVVKKNINFLPSSKQLSLDEERTKTYLRENILMKLQIIPGYISNKEDGRKYANLLPQFLPIDSSTPVKLFIAYGLCLFTLQSLGTNRHLHYVSGTLDGSLKGCYCLTEIGHGSNTKKMKTTATYDPATQQFILNTPDFEAAKCWAGNLGKYGTYAIVYAQLYTVDKKCHGLHAFVVDIRDPKTMLPKPGIIIKDMGAKIDYNGLDNGVIIFKNYRIPRENLLNKNEDVMPDGQYISNLKNPSKKSRQAFGSLSVGRLNIMLGSIVTLIHVLTIAIRYTAVRKDFNPIKNEKLPLLEYQLYQWRLLPYLAHAYIFKIFVNYLYEQFTVYHIKSIGTENTHEDKLLGSEIHILSCVGKSLFTWITMDAFKDCTEACGAHAYLQISNLLNVRNTLDAGTTYEGDNNILSQQASSWLLKFWSQILNDKLIPVTPLNTVYYLSNSETILQSKFSAQTVIETIDYNHILNTYKWLVCFLLKESFEKFNILIEKGQDYFTANCNTQVFYLKSLPFVFLEHFILETTHNIIQKAPNESIRKILSDLLYLHCISSLEKFVSILYQGGYAEGVLPTELIQKSILYLCEKIKPDAVSLVDALTPHDFFMTSPLGQSDGEVYKHLENAFITTPDAVTNAKWLSNILIKHKL